MGMMGLLRYPGAGINNCSNTAVMGSVVCGNTVVIIVA